MYITNLCSSKMWYFILHWRYFFHISTALKYTKVLIIDPNWWSYFRDVLENSCIFSKNAKSWKFHINIALWSQFGLVIIPLFMYSNLYNMAVDLWKCNNSLKTRSLWISAKPYIFREKGFWCPKMWKITFPLMNFVLQKYIKVFQNVRGII